MVRIFRHRDPAQSHRLARYSDKNKAELSEDNGTSWQFNYATPWDILKEYREVSDEEAAYFIDVDQSATKPE